jgi:dTDP-4-dehydrorhamnose reductase
MYGGRGWLGSILMDHLKTSSEISEIILGSSRVENTEDLISEIKEVSPDRIVCLVGRTHGPGCNTIDYLEDKLALNLQDNLFSPLSLGNICVSSGIHLTYFGTGCIFEYDEKHDHDGPGFTEEDGPNFFGSAYSTVKGITDRIFHQKPFDSTVLNVRIRMPIVNYPHSRNFITKIATYEKVIDIPNSMTVIDTLFPVLVDMITRGRVGTVNLVNPGAISHGEILQMYKDIVDDKFTWETFTLEEQDQILKSKRSNNTLETNQLTRWGYTDILDIQKAVKQSLVIW